MASYEATTKQRAYYHSLTGEWPPRGASKSKVSKMIDDAKAGKIKRKARVIRVYGYQAFDVMLGDANSPAGNYTKRKFHVTVDHYQQGPLYETWDEAVAAAEAIKKEGDELLLEPNSTHTAYWD